MSSYFALTNPDSLQVQIMAKFQLSHTQYQYIPIVQAGSAIPFAVVAGFVIDRAGPRFAISLFTLLCIIGLSIFASSSNMTDDNFKMFLVGRAIFGMGAVGQFIWFSTITSIWFYYNNMALAMAAGLCFATFGSLVADVLAPHVYRSSQTLSQALWLSVYIYAFSLVIVIAVNRLEKRNSANRKQIRYVRIATEKLSRRAR
jgi:nitrate/nitrite transporter NarK